MNAPIPSQQASSIGGTSRPGQAAPQLNERLDRAMRVKLTTAVVMQLARWTPYLEKEMLGLSRLVGPGSVCIDIGAAAGLYTLALSRLAGPSGRVYSVEPLSFARPVWTRVLRVGDGQNVSRHNVALGADPGSGVMSVPVGRYGLVTGRSFLTGKSSGLGSNAEFAGQITTDVQVDTLDGLCERAGLTRLDFIKIDVEGAELHVLEGGQRTIEAFMPTMLIEIEARHMERYGYSPDDIVGWLTRRGYSMHTWQQGWRETEGVCMHTRNYLFRAQAAPDQAAPDGETAPDGEKGPGAGPAGSDSG
jgi:FkbM family methyltransferase